MASVAAYNRQSMQTMVAPQYTYSHWHNLKAEPDTIVEISDHTAHLVLIALCKNMGTKQDAKKLIAKFEGTEQKWSLAGQNANSRKRKAGDDDVLVCKQCTNIYTEEENSDTACHFHSGQLKPDYEHDFWCDYDENCHGIIDSDELRREYPEGYMWDCCERLGDTKDTCETSRHSPIHGQKRRRSVGAEWQEADGQDKENENPGEDKTTEKPEIVEID